MTFEEIVAQGLSTLRRSSASSSCSMSREYKRRQAPPGVKISRAQFRPRPPLSHHQCVPGCHDERVIVRFAPSPTGLLHVGNARTAMLNYLFAQQDGRQVPAAHRRHRCRRAPSRNSKTAIIEDLAWLGLDARSLRAPDRPRWRRYQRGRREAEGGGPALSLLRNGGRTRPPAQAPDRARASRRSTTAPRLNLTDAQRAKLEAEGRKPHWRFKLSPQQGEMARSGPRRRRDRHRHLVRSRADPRGRRAFSTPCLRWWTMSISPSRHVIRGEDHVTNTAAQIEIFEALGAAVPAVRAFSAAGRRGRRGAVQAAGLAVAAQSARGRHRAAGARCLSRQDRHIRSRSSRALSLDALAQEFEFEKIGRAPAHFDPAELAALNAKLLHAMPYERRGARLTHWASAAARRSGRR